VRRPEVEDERRRRRGRGGAAPARGQGGGCGGVGADPPSTEVVEGSSGVDPAGKHGAGTEVVPRVRVMRTSREAEAEELE